MSRTICFVARNDFETKPGGDTVQWRMYSGVAERAGMRCLTWFSDGPMPDADVYHAFNIDRPLEIYPRLRAVAARGKPFVLSTIHHPNPWVQEFRRGGELPGHASSLFYRSPLGRSLALSESLKELARLAVTRRFSHVLDVRRRWSTRIRWLLANASAVLVLSTEEASWIERDFEVALSARSVLVPNWVEGIGEGTSTILGDLVQRPVIVVGRIEARKNVLRVARLARDVGRQLVFAGRANPNESVAHELQEIAKTTRYVRWLPGVPRPEIGALYRAAAFLLNASYVEVSPLVDIEALSVGCPVVTTTRALHHELLPQGLRKVDPYEDGDIRDALGWLPDRPMLGIDLGGQARASLVQCYESTARP